MRCANLAETWAELCTWFDLNDVLVLPQLCAGGPLVRLDADIDPARAANPAEVDRMTERLRAVIRRFDVRAVYVHEIGSQLVGGGLPGDAPPREPGVVTVRVLAGGVIHELALFAGWYAEYLDRAVGIESAHSL